MTKPPRRRTWIWFFAVLGALALAAIIIPLIVRERFYGLQAVTPTVLQSARSLWERNGPTEYDMEYQKKGSVTNTFVVQVRQKKAVAVLMDGQPIEPRLYPYHTLDSLMDDMERFMDLASKPGQQPIVLRARFDLRDGHLIRYIYSVPGTLQQIEVSVKLKPVGGAGDGPTPPGY